MSDELQFGVPATERLAQRRRFIGFIEQYLFSAEVRGWVITDLLGALAGVVGSIFFGPLLLLLTLLGLIAVVVVVVVRPLQGVRLLRKQEGKVPAGGEYTGRFSNGEFRLGTPQGRVDTLSYSQIRDVHRRGEFVVFTARISGRMLVYPRGVYPGGDERWLKERAASHAAS